MDSLRKPEMVLSIFNLIGLVTVAVYGYKKSITTSEELEFLKKHLNDVVKRLGDFQASLKKLEELAELVKSLDNTIKAKDNRINSLSKQLDNSCGDIDELTDRMVSMAKQLKDQGIAVQLKFQEEEPVFRGRNPRGRSNPRSSRTSNRRYSDDNSESPDMDNDDPDSQANEFRRRRNNYSDS